MLSFKVDLTQSGRVDRFRVYKVPVNSLNAKETELENVVGGTISWSYYSDKKISGTLEVKGTAPAQADTALRIYYCPKLGSVSDKVELCTCFATMGDGTWENGLWTGSYELSGMPARFTDDELCGDYSAGAGSGCVAHWKRVFSKMGGDYRVNITDREWSKSAILAEAGDPVYKVLSAIADKLGGQIGVDTHGRVTLDKYIVPSKRKLAYVIPSGAASVTEPGLEYSWDGFEKPNRVALRFKEQGEWVKDWHGWWWKRSDGTWPASCWETIHGDDMHFNSRGYWNGGTGGGSGKFTNVIEATATLDSSSFISKANRGRYITHFEDVTELPIRTTAELQKLAKRKLADLTSRSTYYEFDCYFLPIQIGDVVRLNYDTKKKIEGMVTDIDMNIGIGGKMHVRMLFLRKVS